MVKRKNLLFFHIPAFSKFLYFYIFFYFILHFFLIKNKKCKKWQSERIQKSSVINSLIFNFSKQKNIYIYI